MHMFVYREEKRDIDILDPTPMFDYFKTRSYVFIYCSKINARKWAVNYKIVGTRIMILMLIVGRIYIEFS